MSVVNIVWSGGVPYVSIHKVHGQILAQVTGNERVHTWLLQGTLERLPTPCGEIKAWGLSRGLLKGRGLWRLGQWLLHVRLRRTLRRCDARVLVLDGLGVARLCLPLLDALPGVRALVVLHGKSRVRQADIELLRRFQERLQLIAVSESLAASLREQLGASVIALRTAMDPAVFQRPLLGSEQARRELQIPLLDCPLLGAVGRLAPEKGHGVLLEVLTLLLSKGIKLHLVLVGEGELRSALAARIRQLGLSGQVTLAGHHADMARLYRAFDLMLIPSRREPLGLVVQEAVMAGVPVVCSDLPTFSEQIGAAGVYCPVDDVAAWAAAIESVLAGDRTALAASQYCQLAPEQAWEAFCRGYRELLAPDPSKA